MCAAARAAATAVGSLSVGLPVFQQEKYRSFKVAVYAITVFSAVVPIFHAGSSYGLHTVRSLPAA